MSFSLSWCILGEWAGHSAPKWPDGSTVPSKWLTHQICHKHGIPETRDVCVPLTKPLLRRSQHLSSIFSMYSWPFFFLFSSDILLDCSWRDWIPSSKSRIISLTHEKRADTGLHPFYPPLPAWPIMAKKSVPPPIRSKLQVKDLDLKETIVLSWAIGTLGLPR